MACLGPFAVQIEHQRYLAIKLIPVLIHVFAVAMARRIAREMEFGVVKACIEQAIELVLECVGPLQELQGGQFRSEEHTSELQSLMRSSYAVFCLKQKKKHET